MVFPKLLSSNKKIGLVALSSPTSPKNILKGIQRLERAGFSLKIGKSVFAQKGYLAGTPELRANDLIEMWQDPEIDAVFCTRGGYGSTQILSLLPPSLFRQPKIIVGCSDLTSLFLFLQKQGTVCFHGPFFAGDQIHHPINQEALFMLLSQGKLSQHLVSNAKIFQEGNTRGEIVGGNLTLIAHSLGTPYEIQTDQKILFLEDIGEKIYRLDRMMYQLLHSRKFENIKGILLGDFEDCGKEFERQAFFRQFFQEHIIPKHPSIPIISGIRAGHGKINVAFPLGFPMKVTAREQHIRLHLLDISQPLIPLLTE